jgi:hypothetical protein
METLSISSRQFDSSRPNGSVPDGQLGSWPETGFEEMTQGFGSIAQRLQKAGLTIVNLAFRHLNSFSFHMKR